MIDWDELRRQTVVYRVAGMERARVEKDLMYKVADGDALSLDLYHPPGDASTPALPAAVFVHGSAPFLDLKDWGQYVGWGQLAAASGLVGVTFNHRSWPRFQRLHDIAADITDLLRYISENHEALGIRRDKLCIWTCSAGGPAAFNAAMHGHPSGVRCIVLLYAYLNLLHMWAEIPESVTDEDARQFSPLYQLAGHPHDLPMLIVRAGRDRPVITDSIDQFTTEAIARNVPIEFINYPDGRHGFDIRDDNETSRAIIRTALEFMRRHLG